MALPNPANAAGPNPGSSTRTFAEHRTATLIDEARNHTFENGRRYRGCDEGRKLDLFHHCCLLALHGEVCTAPIRKYCEPQKILDVGTGSGAWAIDAADQYPSAQVIGVDIKSVQLSWAPPNVSFEVNDIADSWPYEENSFDFIHIRNLAGFVHDWPTLYQQAFRALKPGGWIEVQELCEYFSVEDATLLPENCFPSWGNYQNGVPVLPRRIWNEVAPGIAQTLENFGCVEVAERMFKLPIGCWPEGKPEKELGMYWHDQMLNSLDGPFALFMQVDLEAIDYYFAGICACRLSPNYHAYTKFYCTYGRKPEE